jgi:hypothetical protein
MNPEPYPLELSSRRALEQAQRLALMWLREAKALEKSRQGYDLGKSVGLTQAAADLKRAVDPQSRETLSTWAGM